MFCIENISCCYVNSVRFKHIDCSLNYERLNLNFLKLQQLPIGGNIEANPGPTHIDCKSPRGCSKKHITKNTI